MATVRKGSNPYSKPSLQFNRELRGILQFLEKNPKSKLRTIAAQVGFSEAKIRNALKVLTEVDLVYVSGKEPTLLKAFVHLFSVCDYTEEDLDTSLPIAKPQGDTMPVSVLSKQGTPTKRPTPSWEEGRAWRDPLHVALMGTGIAPSILFKNSCAF